MKIKILDRDWKVSMLDGDAFKKRFKRAHAAITLPDTFEIVFCADDFCLTTVAHELTHAYIACLCIQSANLTADQMEEVACELLGIHGKSILKMADGIYAAMREDAA